jgi:drug/metabolite transporter (DMT)-like permease
MTEADEVQSRARSLESRWLTATPVLFVLLWSTGFIGARLGLPHAEPFTFLLIRFILVTAILVAVALAWRAPWPKRWTEIRDLGVVGLLIHGVYLGGVFASIKQGLPAAVAALVVGVQPLLTAAAAGPFLGERVSPRQWLGLIVGLAGVALVVADKLRLDGDDVVGLAFAVAALLGITIGTIYQKRHGSGMDLRTGAAVQFAFAGAAALAAALMFERMEVAWTGEFVFALLWLVVVLSIGAISLLWVLIRRGAAARVASLFYLVPPVTAVFAYAMFGDTLGPLALMGMAATVVGVALVTRG